MPQALRAVALLEFLVAATWAGIIAANVFQRVAHRLLMGMAAVWTVHMAVIVVVMVVMVVIMVAIGAMYMGLLVHLGISGIKSPGIISPSRSIRTLRPKNNPVLSLPSRR